MEIFEKMAIFGNFLEKNGNFLAIFEKKLQFSGNFWTFNWQFSGGSGLHSEGINEIRNVGENQS